jgi:hypothetical protein
MYGHFRRVALTACVLFAALPAPMAEAQRVYCRSNRQCKNPDSMTVLLRPGTSEAVLDANFGLVYQSSEGGWKYTCDDMFGGRIAFRTQIAPDGRVFVPAMDGLWIGSEGCGWHKSMGALSNQSVHDVSFERGAPQQVWIVGGDPRVAALSIDGGNTFTAKYTFPPHLIFARIAVAPSDPKVIYVVGYNGTKAPLVMGVSTDGGDTWTLDENAWMGVATSQQIVDFLGVSPDDPHTVYVMVTSGHGDEIWRSTDKGRGLVKVLTLDDQEEWPRGGFAFGDSGKTVYVAGFDPLNTGLQPPASLYVSKDSGATWERRPSPSTGPRYRCIAHRDGKLYACGGEKLAGDDFYLGVSSDEGRTWSSLVRLIDVKGPLECTAEKCAPTGDFLMGFRGLGADAGPPADAMTPTPIPPVKPPKSNGCAFATAPAGAAGPGLVLLATLVLARRRRGGRERE